MVQSASLGYVLAPTDDARLCISKGLHGAECGEWCLNNTVERAYEDRHDAARRRASFRILVVPLTG